MIHRLTVDNFRSLVDFTWVPREETLVLGYNGSGKTSVLDALDAIRTLTTGESYLTKPLSRKDYSRFSYSDAVTLNLILEADEETFDYRVALHFQKERGEIYLFEEALTSSRGGAFLLEAGALHYRDVPSDTYTDAALPTTQSAASFLGANPNTPFVRRFLDALRSIVSVRPIPPKVHRQAEQPEDRPSRSFDNFVAWYWNYSTNGSYSRAMLGLLENVWPEFDHLKIERYGRETWGLGAVFKQAERTTGELSLDFDELSDGERMLVMLYALVAYQKSQPATTIIIDEPDNFVSLLELQPWLRTLLDTRPEGGQIILVSHNPEIIQTMGEERVAWFSREDHLSPTQVTTLPPNHSGLSLPERLARGWIDA